MREEAKVRLEKMFDDEGASKIVKEVLSTHPHDLPTLEFFSHFGSLEETEPLSARLAARNGCS